MTTIDSTNISNSTDFRKIWVISSKNLQRTQNQVYKLVLYIIAQKVNLKFLIKLLIKGMYKKIEEVVKNNIKNWNYNEK